jgi:hypothetical protein
MDMGTVTRELEAPAPLDIPAVEERTLDDELAPRREVSEPRIETPDDVPVVAA